MDQSQITLQVSVEMLCGNAENGASLSANIVRALREIDRVGSIHKAIKNLHMSYSNTLSAIVELEQSMGCSLVKRVRPGGSTLTEEGRRLISCYEQAREKIQTYALTIAHDME